MNMDIDCTKGNVLINTKIFTSKCLFSLLLSDVTVKSDIRACSDAPVLVRNCFINLSVKGN